KGIKEGKKIRVLCRAFGGFPEPYVQWLVAGKDVSKKAVTTFEKNPEGTYKMISILEVTALQGVKYICSIWNEYIEKFLVDWVIPLPGLKVQTPMKTITGFLGSTVELKCDITLPGTDFTLMEHISVFWVKVEPSGEKKLVYSMTNGEETLFNQSKLFFNRTKFFRRDFLSEGKAYLKLSNVILEDIGSYVCQVINKTKNMSGKDLLKLRVVSPYTQPVVTYGDQELKDNGKAYLFCETKNGFPLGHIKWMKNNKRDISEQAETNITMTSNGLYDFISKLETVLKANERFTCVITNPWLQDSKSGSMVFIVW
uniref:Ig-like domain-containing protein n=2 Tax=Latimeria chalumnae TaxID=7897 RepID=H3BI58_LATCH